MRPEPKAAGRRGTTERRCRVSGQSETAPGGGHGHPAVAHERRPRRPARVPGLAIPPTVSPSGREVGSTRRHDRHEVDSIHAGQDVGRHPTTPDAVKGLITKRSRVQIPSQRRTKPQVKDDGWRRSRAQNRGTIGSGVNRHTSVKIPWRSGTCDSRSTRSVRYESTA